MTTAATMYRLPNCRLFASGKYRGSEWTAADVDEMAENGPKLVSLLTPPAVLGHEEEQEWLDRTDLEAAGWIDPRTLRSVPDEAHPGHKILMGDVVNVPPEVAALIRQGKFKYPSVEVYDEFPDDFGNLYGKTVRRVALLGGEVPQVKRLGPLPMPVPMGAPLAFSERPPPPRKPTDRLFALSFAERAVGDPAAVPDRATLIKTIQAVAPVSQATLETNTDDQLKEWVANLPKPQPPGAVGMDRAAMIAEMVAAGVPQAELDALDDAALKAKYDEWKAVAGAPAAAVADPAVAMMGDPAAMTREELIAELSANGQDAAALEAMSDDDLRALYTSLGLGAVAEAPAVDAAAAPAVAAMSEQAKRHLRTIARSAAFAEQGTRQLRKALHGAKVNRVTEFCDKLVRAGKVTPAMVEEFVRPLLLMLDDTKAVHKFSDGGKAVQGTALERKMARALAMPSVVRFGEKVPGGPGAAQTTHEAEVRKVERFAETLGDGVLRAAGQTREQFVQKFSEAAKKRPGLTAAQYLGPTANVG